MEIREFGIRRTPSFKCGLAHFVIPDLIRDPVVFCHVVCMRVYSSGSRVKHGMTATDRLDWKRVNSLFIRVFEIFARK